VSELQLEIPRASIYGFLGPNGSGKTTAIRMLCGLIAPSAGRADVLGYRMPRDAEKLRQHIGYMPQKNALYTDLTVLENLHFMARIQGVARRDAQQRSNELLQRYQLDRFRDSLVAGLSGGERQKAALAVAILHRPALLFLDEPTSEVDPQSRRDFWDSLFELVDGGTTILLTSHFMDEAERCHRLAVLHRGRKMVDGAPAQLMSQIDASVVLVDPVDARAARQCLLAASFVLSVAQIGSTLRVLVDKAERQPHQVVRSWLRQQGIVAECTAIRANLEDVFVVATQLARQA
jgi:ABC-2 type transport system ATP-binding protein